MIIEARINENTGEVLTIGHGRLQNDLPEVITVQVERDSIPRNTGKLNRHVKYEGGRIVAKTEIDLLPQFMADSLDDLDRAAGEARERFITKASGQESVYAIKLDQAREFAKAGYTGKAPSMIEAEAIARESTEREAADFILSTAAQWIAVASQIEQVKQTGKNRIKASGTRREIEQHRDTALAGLAVIKPE